MKTAQKSMCGELTDEVRAARDALTSAAGRLDPGGLTGPQAVTLLGELGVLHRLVEGMVGKVAKRVDDTAAHTRESDRSAAELTARVVGVSPSAARRSIATAGRLEGLPVTDAAVRAGKLSTAQAELVAVAAVEDPRSEQPLLRTATRGIGPLRDAVIAARARREGERSRRVRQRRARYHRIWTTADGMVAGAYELPPEEGATVKVRLEAETRRIFRERRKTGEHESQEAYAADALVAAVVDSASGPVRKRVGHTVHVVVDHDALTRGETAGDETCEIPGVGPVSVEWVRSRLGAAFVTAIVKKGKDVRTVAHLGRHIPVELMTALVVGGRECVVEGCSGRAYLEIDHSEIDYAAGGPTALWNLDWECWTHHRPKTQGWVLGPPDPATGKRRLDRPPEPGRAVG